MECDHFGSVLTAINTVAQAIGANDITSLVTNKTQYTITKTNQLLFVVQIDTGFKQVQITRLLETVKSIFFKHFPPEQYWGATKTTQPQSTLRENDDWIGHVPFSMDKYQMLDAEYEKLFAGPKHGSSS